MRRAPLLAALALCASAAALAAGLRRSETPPHLPAPAGRGAAVDAPAAPATERAAGRRELAAGPTGDAPAPAESGRAPDALAELAALLDSQASAHAWDRAVRASSRALDGRDVAALTGLCADARRTPRERVVALELLRGVAERGDEVAAPPGALLDARLLAARGAFPGPGAVAARALARFGSSADRIAIADRLALEPDARVRRALAWALAASPGEDVVPAAVALLEGGARSEALVLLATLDASSWSPATRDEVARAVAPGPATPGAPPDARAVAALASLDGPASRAALLAAVREGPGDAAAAAAIGLARDDDPGARQQLASLLGDEPLDPARRRLVVDALARRADGLPEAVRATLQQDVAARLRADVDPGARRAAAWSAARLGPGDALRALEHAAGNDRDPSVRRAASRALATARRDTSP